ncbi:MAG: Cytochrome c oxidase subunit 1, bacteroid [Candidatus Omnitrophica bacterium]|nr:Cytochrome c oxidase subunit 1, bacteroid [Candidatus Omnitrophota bacterium]
MVETHPDTLVDRRLVKAHLIAALVFLAVGLLGGLLYSLQLLQHYPLAGIEIFSAGRIRMVHTASVAYGFIVNGFLGALNWAVPRLTGNRTCHRYLGWFIFVAWQVILLASAVGIMFGYAQGVEWAETPVFIDPVVVLGLILVAVHFLAPIMRTGDRNLYVSLWYFSVAFIWTIFVYIMGNYFPEFFVPGAAGAALAGLFIHDLVGLLVTPLGWGLMYYFVPILLRKPIWSHGLSLIGFWGLAFFYPLNGIHHFFYSPIPMYLQYGAIIATIAVELIVTTVIVNFFITLGRQWGLLGARIALRWFYMGMILYFITCLQCSFHTTLTFQKIIHFSDWVVGHAHLVMFGVFGFWIFGMINYLWPRVTGHEWYSTRLNEWHYWITVISLWVMVIDLTAAGLVQGFMWRALAPWEETLKASMPFWLIRSISGTTIIIAQGLYLYNVWQTARGRSARRPQEAAPAAGAA